MRGRRLSLVLFLSLHACGASEQSPSDPNGQAEQYNILLFVVDTLRADRLGCYGHDAPTSPNIDAFAAKAQLFEKAWAPSPYTATSHASLFTSTFPFPQDFNLLP